MEHVPDIQCRFDELIARGNECTEQFNDLLGQRALLVSQDDTLKHQISSVTRILNAKSIDESLRHEMLSQFPDLTVLHRQRQELVNAHEALTEEIDLYLSQHGIFLSAIAIFRRATKLYTSVVEGILPSGITEYDVIAHASFAALELYYGGINNPIGEGHGHAVLDNLGVVVYHRYPST